MSEGRTLSVTENRAPAHDKMCSLHRVPRNAVCVSEDCLYIDNAEHRGAQTSAALAEEPVRPEILAVHPLPWDCTAHAQRVPAFRKTLGLRCRQWGKHVHSNAHFHKASSWFLKQVKIKQTLRYMKPDASWTLSLKHCLKDTLGRNAVTLRFTARKSSVLYTLFFQPEK